MLNSLSVCEFKIKIANYHLNEAALLTQQMERSPELLSYFTYTCGKGAQRKWVREAKSVTATLVADNHNS